MTGPVDVVAIKAALAKAKPGPWRAQVYADAGDVFSIWSAEFTSFSVADDVLSADADLIVLLRNNAEALLDELERAQAASEGVDMLVAQAERRGAEAMRARCCVNAKFDETDFSDLFDDED
jgi:hypothetical protein